MKRYFFLIAIAAMAFASCDELSNSKNGGNIGGNDQQDIVGPGVVPTPPLSPDQQKTKLADVAEDIMDLCPSNDFEHLVSIAEDFMEYFEDRDYDLSELYEWVENQEDKVNKETGSTTVKGNKVTNDYTWEVIAYLSNHEALFNFGADKVTVSKYNGTKATFTLNGKKYEAEIKTQGNVTKAVYLQKSWQKENNYGYWDAEKDEWIETNNLMEILKNNETKITIGVPDKLIIDLTENGSSLAKITAEFKTDFNSKGIKLTTDAFAVSTKVEINGYELTVNNSSYNGSTGKAEVSYSLKKDGTTIFKASASANVKIAMNEKVYEDGYDDYSYSYSYTEIEVTKADKITVGLDIMGQIQVVGTFSDVFEAERVSENLWEALDEDNTSSVENYLEDLNEMLDLGVYYDNGSNRQASVELEIESHDDGWEEYYSIVPVLVFTDDSRHSIEDFFTQQAFGSVVDSFYALVESYSEVFGIFAEDKPLEGYPY